jgi:hypothetical protein
VALTCICILADNVEELRLGPARHNLSGIHGEGMRPQMVDVPAAAEGDENITPLDTNNTPHTDLQGSITRARACRLPRGELVPMYV